MDDSVGSQVDTSFFFRLRLNILKQFFFLFLCLVVVVLMGVAVFVLFVLRMLILFECIFASIRRFKFYF
jgi:hypothetical protein